ncbi:MAG: lysophospholipid acyltransferase (LPLAT)-like uncharacterized protein [Rickettsiales bacterium]|jgi:lysophospholipid acyltransferase (LPLAT)-like uncharacterized protein
MPKKKKRPSWFDIKTKFKKIIRSIFYTKIGQDFVCFAVAGYVKAVYYSSKVKIVHNESVVQRFKDGKSVIISSWHNQIMMTPFVAIHAKKVNSKKKLAALASKHGDGKFVGKVMGKFGIINIAGSTKDGRKSSRGIDMHGLKEIFRALKNQLGIAITPDGPRGPAQKINGEVIKIARLSGSPIVPIGVACSGVIELRTWDKFKIPLPFSVVTYYYGEEFFIDKDVKDDEIPALNLLLEAKMNFAVEQANKKIKN